MFDLLYTANALYVHRNVFIFCCFVRKATHYSMKHTLSDTSVVLEILLQPFGHFQDPAETGWKVFNLLQPCVLALKAALFILTTAT